ncbi:MAG: hypothetical protein J5940_04135, partial [Clostridia bacterium]|nr:hypothetical protein [Clostridia bacterium]
MEIFEIKNDGLLLRVDAQNQNYTAVLKSGAVWTITKKPYVRFASGETVVFPAPKETRATRTGTFDGVRSYFDLPGKE